jgi:MFS family permease
MTETVTAPPVLERLTGRALGVLLVLCGAAFLEGIDIAMFTIALPVIREDLGVTTGELQWIVSAYILGYGGFMLLGGRAADLFGRRRMFLIALVVFMVFSGLGGLATGSTMLIVARVVTGIAAAFLMPAGLSIITTSYVAGHARDRALLIYAGVGAGGFSLGLVAGGLLSLFGWRWVFFAPLLISALLLVASLLVIPRTDERRVRGRLDVLGALSITGALVALVFGIENATHGAPLVTVAALAAGVALLVLFVVIERRTPQPLVRLGILRTGGLVRANIGMAALGGSFLGFQFVVVLYLQEYRGWSSLETALALLVLAIDMILAPLLTPRLVRRFGHQPVILGGFIAAAASFLLFLPVTADWTYAAMFPSFLALGLAFTFAYGPLTIAATEGISEDEQGLAGGLLYTSFQFGGALGLAITAAVYTAIESGSGVLAATQGSMFAPLGIAVVALAVTATGLRRGRRVILPG